MNESRATRYQRRCRRIRRAAGLSVGIVLAIAVLTPAGRWLAEAAEAIAPALPPGPRAAVALSAYVFALVLLVELAVLPAALYQSLRLDRAYAVGADTAAGALVARLRSAGLSVVLAWVAAGLVHASVLAVGRGWWVLSGAGLAVVLGGLLHLGPFLLARFVTLRRLSKPGLGNRLAELARRVRVPVAGFDEWATASGGYATALVTGVGRSRRVLLSSEMVRDWPEDEVVVVVAHELAHHAHYDLWRAMVLNVALLAGALWLADVVVGLLGGRLGLAGAADLAALPLIALVVAGVWVLTVPIRHAQSRRHERRADLFALQSTGSAAAFGAAVRRLGARRLAEDRPSTLTRWFHHRHPPAAERLATAEAYARLEAPGRLVRPSS